MNYNEVYLKSLRLVNFQSWEDCTVEFRDGINVVVAPNNTGKSVQFKALHLAVMPEKFDSDSREDFLRGDSEVGHIIYEFSEGSIYDIAFTNTKNYYYLIQGSSKTLIGNTPPQELLDLLGIILRGGLIGNLIDFRNDMFLVDSDTSLNESTLSLLINDPRIQDILSSLTMDKIPKTKDIIKSLEYKRSGLISSMGNTRFIDIESAEVELKYAERLAKDIKKLTNIAFVINSIKPFKIIEDSIPKELNSSKILNSFYTSLKTLKPVYEIDKGITTLVTICSNLNTILVNTKELSKLKYSSLIKAVSNLSILNDAVKNPIKEIIVDNNIIKIAESLESLGTYLKQASEIKDLVSSIEDMKIELEEEEGEIYECPIHGSIKYVRQECIPYYK